MIQLHGACDSDAIQGKVSGRSRSVMSEADLTGLQEPDGELLSVLSHGP